MRRQVEGLDEEEEGWAAGHLESDCQEFKRNKKLKIAMLHLHPYLILITLTSGLYYKSFIIIIYNHNVNGHYYITTIIANLALARSIYYDCKVCCKLKHTFTIINCDPKPFIVQATGPNNFAINCKNKHRDAFLKP